MTDDLYYAIEYNPPEQFSKEDILEIVAEVVGENDEFSWWWVIKMKNKKYFLLEGWCDYTGWDCQSGINEYGYFNTALKAGLASPEKCGYSNRAIRKNLVGQIKGKYPKFTYWED